MPVSSTYSGGVTIVETIGNNAAGLNATKKSITYDQFGNAGTTLNGGTTPAVSADAVFQKALSAGAATIDLTNLTGTNGATVSFNGLAVRHAYFRNPATNANPITITFGASNPYLLLGSGFSITLKPGQEVPINLGAGGPTVGSGAKNIDLSGTGSQALDVALVAG